MEYAHGGDIYGEHKIIIDFSVNTNPLGMPEAVKRAVMEQAESWSVYPDSRCRELKEKLAGMYRDKFSCPDDMDVREAGGRFLPEDFLCGNGAADLLYSLIFALKPQRALLFTPCFGEYEAALCAVGCETRTVCLKEENGFSIEFNTEKLQDMFTEELDIIILGNPNNPTGTAIFAAELEEWARICLEKHIILLVDECFNGFLEEGEAYSTVPFLEAFPNVVVLNAFTKLYAMAGLRLGYLISKNREILERVEGCRQPWSVSAPASTAGLTALEQEEFLKKTGMLVAVEREFLQAGLKNLGFIVYPSQVNFLLFKRTDDMDYYGLCREQGILIRSCQNFEGLDGTYYRVAVKARAENEALLEVLHSGQNMIKREGE